MLGAGGSGADAGPAGVDVSRSKSSRRTRTRRPTRTAGSEPASIQYLDFRVMRNWVRRSRAGSGDLAPAGSDNPSASTQAMTSSEGYGALLEVARSDSGDWTRRLSTGDGDWRPFEAGGTIYTAGTGPQSRHRTMPVYGWCLGSNVRSQPQLDLWTSLYSIKSLRPTATAVVRALVLV